MSETIFPESELSVDAINGTFVSFDLKRYGGARVQIQDGIFVYSHAEAAAGLYKQVLAEDLIPVVSLLGNLDLVFSWNLL